MNLKELTDTSDIVITGKVQSILEKERTTINENGDHIPTQQFDALISVDNVVKGVWTQSSITIRYLRPIGAFGGYTDVTPQQIGMFFIKKSANGFIFTSPSKPAVAIVPNIAINGETPYDRVVSQFAGTILSIKTTNSEKASAIRALFLEKNSNIPPVLHEAIKHKDRSVKLTAVAGLIIMGDTTVLSVAEKELISNNNQQLDHEQLLLTGAIQSGITQDQVETIPILGHLLHAKDVEVRRAAALSLNRIASNHQLSSMAPFLVFALDDKDPKVRMEVVQALAKVEHDADIWGSYFKKDFETNEQKYLNHWKQWAKENNVKAN